MPEESTIPMPVAYPGTRVQALNPRAKNPVWEDGTCLDAEFKLLSCMPGGHWSYRVRLDRQSASGSPLIVSVDNSDIRVLSCEAAQEDEV